MEHLIGKILTNYWKFVKFVNIFRRQNFAPYGTDVQYNHYVISVVLPAPSNVKPGVVKSTSTEVTWDRSDGATGYYILCTSTGHDDKEERVNNGDTTKCTFSNLVENTPYVITVQSLNTDHIKGDKSGEVLIRTGE